MRDRYAFGLNLLIAVNAILDGLDFDTEPRGPTLRTGASGSCGLVRATRPGTVFRASGPGGLPGPVLPGCTGRLIADRGRPQSLRVRGRHRRVRPRQLDWLDGGCAGAELFGNGPDRVINTRRAPS
jgi:hypothetical protein